ncbi:MAG: hypothetical protein QOD98_920 [Nocardioidaceae bacterium]|nr:hypothetical protein [Nocardioidaceae bacterium]
MEIRLARTRFDVFAAFVLIGYAAIFTALLWVATAVVDLGDTALLVVLIALVVLWLFWSGTYVFSWTRIRRIEAPLGLHDFGLFARSPFGELTAPWETVQSATIERAWSGRRLRVRLVPAADARFEQVVHTNLNPRMFTIIQREGLRYSLRILDVSIDQLREAFVVQSGGRVRVT